MMTVAGKAFKTYQHAAMQCGECYGGDGEGSDIELAISG